MTCSAALRELPQVSRGTIVEGDLVNCRNPSAVAWKKIQAIKSSTMNVVEEYIERCRLDDRVSNDLREMPEELQIQVCESEPVNARNPSAVVASRISAVRKNSMGGYADSYSQQQPYSSPRGDYRSGEDYSQQRGGRQSAGTYHRGGGGGGGGGGASVEEYLQRHGIDDGASEKFRALPPHKQEEVMAKDLSNCRNPSAVLLSRIKQVS
eukprot:gnl/TRDRNA2_/TRDRNA2_171937_c2_seq1.p2 gnl/TRDRNA2_/TRDRNA2_171937_c2~~gnl/TRDRNA2_/TRDRNA2_171937_c2_seq1.p2  ORF type:complete len:209 (+),score=35.40 gnl/TRDRNA2_/TRDRNA2_171937_c2_seq1:681-1307(+)